MVVTIDSEGLMYEQPPPQKLVLLQDTENVRLEYEGEALFRRLPTVFD